MIIDYGSCGNMIYVRKVYFTLYFYYILHFFLQKKTAFNENSRYSCRKKSVYQVHKIVIFNNYFKKEQSHTVNTLKI